MHALLKLLMKEHKEVKKDLSLVLEDKEKEEKYDCKLIDKICTELARHMNMEERYLYPVIGKKQALKKLTEEAQLEHASARKLVKELESKQLSDVECKVKLEMLQLDIEHHVEEEENEVFPKIEEYFSKEQLDNIYDEIKAFKEQAELMTAKR